jgi:carboxypeptidase PM20D1
LLPGTDKDQFVKQFEEKMADPSVKVSILEWQKADASPYDTELFKVIGEVANSAGPAKAPVVPVIVPWFTDSHWFRAFGTTAYGFVPYRVDQEHLATMHGKNERISAKYFVEGVHLLTKIVEGISNR